MQQHEEQQEESTTGEESNENQDQNENQDIVKVNDEHPEDEKEMIQEDVNDDINYSKDNYIFNPNVMEIKGIVQGEADNNVVQSASRFSAVDDEENKVWICIVFFCSRTVEICYQKTSS